MYTGFNVLSIHSFSTSQRKWEKLVHLEKETHTHIKQYTLFLKIQQVRRDIKLVNISIGEHNTILSAYTLFRHLK